MWTVAMCFLFSIAFEIISKNFFGSDSTEASTGEREPKLGERRNTETGHKRYYDEEELDVGLGLVTEEETTVAKTEKDGQKVGLKTGQTTVDIMYCIG